MANEVVRMPELFDDDLRAELAALRKLSDEEHVAGFQKAWEVTVAGVRTASLHLRCLIERGKDVDWLIEHLDLTKTQSRFLRGLRDVAFGKLIPDLFLSCVKRKGLLTVLTSLPPKRQLDLVRGKGLPLREFAPDGSPTVRNVSPFGLSVSLLNQLFDSDGQLRSLEAQDAYIAAQRRPQLADEEIRVGRGGQWKVDRIKRGAWRNGKFYPESEFRAILRALDE